MIERLACVTRIVGVGTVLLVALVVLALSTLFALVSSVLLGVYWTMADVVATREASVVTIGSATAFSPFTGLIRGRVAAAAMEVPGVEAVTVEVVAPALVNGTPGVIRGVDPSSFGSVVRSCRVVSELLNLSCLSCAIVGRELADYVGAREGSLLVVRSLFTRSPIILRVVGVVDCGEPYSGEVIVPLAVAQAARGARGDAVSFVRVRVAPGSGAEDLLLERLGAPQESRQGLPLYVVERALEVAASRGGVLSSGEAVDVYLKRVGLSQDALSALAVVVLCSLSYCSYVLGRAVVALRRRYLASVRDLGVTGRRIKAWVAVLLTPVATCSSCVGLALGWVLAGLFGFQMLTYRIMPAVELRETCLALLVLPSLFALGVLTEEV